jgi:hypothetical protein
MPSSLSAAPLIPADQSAVMLQNAATGTGNGTPATLDSRSLFVTLSTSGGVSTVIPEHSFDAGSTWETAYVEDLVAGTAGLLGSITTAVGVQRYRYRPSPGVNRVRMRISAFSSGSITCTALERRLS